MRNYRRLLSYALPYKWIFISGIVGMVVVALSEASFAALLKPIMAGGFVERDSRIIALTPLLLIGAFLVRGLGSFADQYSIGWIGRRVIYDLRAEMFSKILRLPTQYYDANSSGQLVAKLIYDLEQIAQATTMALRVLIKDSILIVALLGWLAFLNWQLTTIFIAVTPIAALIIQIASKKFRSTSKKIQSSVGQIARASKESFESQKLVKAFDSYLHEQARFRKHNLWNRKESIRKAAIGAASVPLLLIIVGFAVSGIIYIAMTSQSKELVTPGTFASYLAAILMLMAPIKRLAMINELLQTGITAATSAFEILDSEVEDRVGSLKEGNIRGSVNFQNVSFRYSKDKPLVLSEISFSLNPGETIAFVGTSGSGKTTIGSILLGFYSSFSGDVLIDGSPINDYELAFLRKNIAYVPQDTILFDDTIENNVLYGRDKYNERYDTVTKITQIDKLAKELHNSQGTIGEQGSRLSGGQRQRVSITRGLYSDAPILILDEATSALDNIAENQIRTAISSLSKKQSVIIIAHRLSTVVDADRIYVMKDSKIIESGTHSSLISKNGFYAALYHEQDRIGLSTDSRSE